MLKNRALDGFNVTEEDDWSATVMFADVGNWAPLLPMPPTGVVVCCLDCCLVDAVDDLEVGGSGAFFLGVVEDDEG